MFQLITEKMIMSNDRTIYTILDELKTNSTISLFKLDADVLQEISGNVHALVQKTYNKVTKAYPSLSRRKKGNLVRFLMSQKAINSPIYSERLNQYL